MKKKSLLFVIDSLECAGAEKSLVSLLTLLDYSRFDVDLLLFAHGKALEELVPKEVNILPPLPYTKFAHLSYKEALYSSMKKGDFRMLSSRMKYSFAIRRKTYSNAQKARIYWERVADSIEPNPKSYDAAISYAQGVPTFYVAEKVTAKLKLAWVNVSYRLETDDQQFQRTRYEKFDRIVAVSESAKSIFLETFPSFQRQMEVIYDIQHATLITQMAALGKGYDDHFDGIRILTIGRLAHQKGYDLALQACKKLKETGIPFRWYALGKGPLQAEIENKVREYGLTDHFILLGVKANPYPFLKQADLYVQTSRFEGFGLAIAEARILNIPVVTTRFDAVYSQMRHGKNGLVVDMDSDAIFAGIQEMITNERLRESVMANLHAEKKGNEEEIERFYQLLESKLGTGT